MSVQSPRRKVHGFTLIELMVTVAVAAIIAAIALPIYQYQVRKSRRTEARSSLLDLAGRAERLYATTNSYQNAATGALNPTDVGYTGAWPVAVGSGYYTVNLTASSPTQFAFTATPVGMQTADTQCQAFTVDNTGKQSSVNSSNSDSTATCWN
jgi:type IV pilus assembly protein PilE